MKKKISLVILLLLSLAMILIYFYPLIGRLNSILLVSGGDGIKNYFTYIFYINNDIGVHFTGMNYPFGEHVVFTDNMPFLAWTVKYLSLYFPGVASHALGIMHASLFLSLIIGVVYIYKILKIFSVQNWLSIAGSIFIIFFSPQLFKLFGHFGMAYLMYLPMLIYWLMKYDRSQKWKYLVFIIVCSSIFTFIHVYNLAFVLILICSYVLSKWIIAYKYGWKNYLRLIIPLLFSIMIAGLVFVLFLKFTDTIKDRTVYPYGVFGGKTTGVDIYLSQISPLGFIFQFLFGKASGPSESYVYIGFISTLISIVLVIYLLRFVYIRISKKSALVALHPVRDFRLWLLTSIFILLFGMGVPFVWNLEFLADYIPAFRQFRVMGRFSWSFYYLFLIFSVIFISRFYQWMIRKKYIWQAKVIIAIVFGVWTVQLSGYVNYFKDNMDKQAVGFYEQYTENNTENWSQWLHSKGYNPKDFQAILALPFFHIGSEKLWLQDNNESATMYAGSQLALQTGIPMIDVMMSRTSLSQSFASAQIIDGEFSKKPILYLFSNKDVLVLVNKSFPLKEKEKEWIKDSHFIGQRHDFDIFSVNPAMIIQKGQEFRDSILLLAYAKTEDIGLLGKDSSLFYFVNHFDKESTDFHFAGIGGYIPKVYEKQRVIASIQPRLSDSSNHDYQFSIWVKCNNDDYRSPYFIFRQYDKDGNLIDESDASTKYSTRVINYWFLTDKALTFKPNMKKLDIVVVSSSPLSYIALDELAIWPLESIYFYKKDGKLFLNNRPQ